jgi:hypothetical protein
VGARFRRFNLVVDILHREIVEIIAEPRGGEFNGYENRR